MLRCILVARKNLTSFLTGSTGRSKNLDPTSFHSWYSYTAHLQNFNLILQVGGVPGDRGLIARKAELSDILTRVKEDELEPAVACSLLALGHHCGRALALYPVRIVNYMIC